MHQPIMESASQPAAPAGDGSAFAEVPGGAPTGGAAAVSVLEAVSTQRLLTFLEHAVMVCSEVAPPLQVVPWKLLQRVRARLAALGVSVRDIRLEGSAAGNVLNPVAITHCNDLDLVIHLASDAREDLEVARDAFLGAVAEFTGVRSGDFVDLHGISEAYLRNMFITPAASRTEAFALFSLYSELPAPSIDVKFVQHLSRPYQFSVDSFQIVLDPALAFLEAVAGLPHQLPPQLPPNAALYPALPLLPPAMLPHTSAASVSVSASASPLLLPGSPTSKSPDAAVSPSARARIPASPPTIQLGHGAFTPTTPIAPTAVAAGPGYPRAVAPPTDPSTMIMSPALSLAALTVATPRPALPLRLPLPLPTVVFESAFGNTSEAVAHLGAKLIAVHDPVDVTRVHGGGLLKYAHLLVLGFQPLESLELQRLEHCMVTRFLADHPISQFSRIGILMPVQRICDYLDAHFNISTEQRQQFLRVLVAIFIRVDVPQTPTMHNCIYVLLLLPHEPMKRQRTADILVTSHAATQPLPANGLLYGDNTEPRFPPGTGGGAGGGAGGNRRNGGGGGSGAGASGNNGSSGGASSGGGRDSTSASSNSSSSTPSSSSLSSQPQHTSQQQLQLQQQHQLFLMQQYQQQAQLHHHHQQQQQQQYLALQHRQQQQQQQQHHFQHLQPPQAPHQHHRRRATPPASSAHEASRRASPALDLPAPVPKKAGNVPFGPSLAESAGRPVLHVVQPTLKSPSKRKSSPDSPTSGHAGSNANARSGGSSAGSYSQALLAGKKPRLTHDGASSHHTSAKHGAASAAAATAVC